MSDEQNKAFLEQLTAEYKIIQDKIDKIGGFRFTIRGWSVTLVTASIASIIAANPTRPVAPLLALPLLVFIVLFAMVEQKQNELELHFGARAFQVEREIHRVVRDMGEGPVLSPRLRLRGVSLASLPPSLQSGSGEIEITDAEPFKSRTGRTLGFAPRIAHFLKDARRRAATTNWRDQLREPSWRSEHLLAFYGSQVGVVIVTGVALLILAPQPRAAPPSIGGHTTVIEYHQTEREPGSVNEKNASTTNSKAGSAKPSGR